MCYGISRAVIIGTAMSLMAAGLSTLAAASVVFQDDFDTYPTGSTPAPPWTESYSDGRTRSEAAADGVTATIDESISMSGKSWHFLDSAGTLLGSPSVQCEFSRSFAPTSHVVLEFFMRSDDVVREGVFVDLVGDAGVDYSISFGASAGGGTAGYIGLIDSGDPGWHNPNFLPYTPGAWYYVRRELDCTTNIGTFYVEEVGNPSINATASLGSDPAFPNTYIDQIRLHTSASQWADAHIDEIMITDPDACDCNGNGTPDDQDIASGFSLDCNGNGIPDECDIPGDVNGDGCVNITDLGIVLAHFGECVYP